MPPMRPMPLELNGRPVQSVAILVCTLKRPQAFKTFIKAVNKLALPQGCRLTLCIADNNPVSEKEGYIGEALQGFEHQVSYGFEAVRGYTTARNKSLELGLATDAQAFLITDDDVQPQPTWIVDHLEALATTRAHFVCGANRVERSDMWSDLALIQNLKRGVGTFNLAFIREAIDPAGMGLAFDMAFNLTGGEDQDFLLRAGASGARLVWSQKALVLPQNADWATDPDAAFQELANLMLLRGSKARNDAAKAKSEGKILKLLGALTANSLGALVLYGLNLITLPIAALISKTVHLKHKARLVKFWGKFIGPWQGLLYGPIARQDVRRNF